MTSKVLFVDDEPAVLDLYKEMLCHDFDLDTALGGEEGLSMIRERGPYPVVISDMRMAGMNGSQFLAQVRQHAPNTVRMLLTGYADLSAATSAVNEGYVFRFLAKPCKKEVLVKAIASGLDQYRLITAEKELLENTLMGSIRVLTEILSLASPEAFGRSMRIARSVRALLDHLSLPSPWLIEAAAMLSQLGCVALDSRTIQAAYAGDHLSAENQTRFAAHSRVARDLLAHIPRLEPIAWMISQQLNREPMNSAADGSPLYPEEIVLGAKILRLAAAFDDLRMEGLSHGAAIAKLRKQPDEFDSELVEALGVIKPDDAQMEARKVLTAKLATGMIVQQEIRTSTGALVVPKGQEVTHALLLKLDNFLQAGTVDLEIVALVPLPPQLQEQ
jgi:response regulator RpfG family c-di-GMP phosphodiesterase